MQSAKSKCKVQNARCKKLRDDHREVVAKVLAIGFSQNVCQEIPVGIGE